MDQVTGRLLVLLVTLMIAALLLRRRYGNIYKVMTDAVERATGLQMATIWRALGILTLVGWLLVYLLYGGEKETGLDRLFRGLFQAPSGEAGAE
jgi:hypothetical protein